MGNKNSCCAYSSPPTGRKNNDFVEAALELEESIGNLQHISEREPEDCDADPSLHPMAGTIFLERSKISMESKCKHNLNCSQLARFIRYLGLT